MPNIPDIVKEHVLKNCGRMPETEQEVNDYLDLINHAKEYEKAIILEKKFSKKFMRRLGIKTSAEVKEEGEKLFNKINS